MSTLGMAPLMRVFTSAAVILVCAASLSTFPFVGLCPRAWFLVGIALSCGPSLSLMVLAVAPCCCHCGVSLRFPSFLALISLAVVGSVVWVSVVIAESFFREHISQRLTNARAPPAPPWRHAISCTHLAPHHLRAAPAGAIGVEKTIQRHMA